MKELTDQSDEIDRVKIQIFKETKKGRCKSENFCSALLAMQ